MSSETTFTLEEIKQGCEPLWNNVECLTCSRLLGYIKDLLSCIEGRGVENARKLTRPEINHLLGLLEAERESGEYTGPREQYYARTKRLIRWCQE
jgi:hypothetical protein